MPTNEPARLNPYPVSYNRSFLSESEMSDEPEVKKPPGRMGLHRRAIWGLGLIRDHT